MLSLVPGVEFVPEAFDVIDLAAWIRGRVSLAVTRRSAGSARPEGADRDGQWLFKPRRIKPLVVSEERRRRRDTPNK